MTIAIVTTPENAIATLTDLIEEVRDELDDDGFSEAKIYRAIARAEAVFNRELRCPKMETEYQFAVTEEATDFPADFLQLRQVYQEGSPDSPLRSMSPASLRKLYRGQVGAPQAYAIENRRIMVAPVGNTTLTILYFARIPALTEDNPVNWLLDEHPDVYLHQILAIIFNKLGDSEKAALNLSIARELIEQINSSGNKNRWGSGPLVPAGIQQAYGARR